MDPTRPNPDVDAAYTRALRVIVSREGAKRRPTADEVRDALPASVPMGLWAVRLMLAPLHRIHGL
jgi:hypothetical protein